MVRGYHWRAMKLGDLEALAHFDQVCSKLDGSIHTSSLGTWKERLSHQTPAESNSIIAINAKRNVLAAGWLDYSLELEEVRAFLDGRVHPAYRGQNIGKALLSWLETKATEHLQAIREDRKMVLRIMFYYRPPDAIKLFEKSGFSFMYTEIEMKFNLEKPLPEYSSLPETIIESWSRENCHEFYLIYQDAFQTRTDSLMQEDVWNYHFTNIEANDFLPELSLILKQGGHPIGYTVCHIEEVSCRASNKDAWITQMGVRQAFRRQGIASQLLRESLRRMSNTGYSNAMLSVNLNNPSAKKVYEKVGFETIKTFTMYSKKINA